MKTYNGRIESILNKLKDQHNSEFELVRGGPGVTWADRELVDVIETQQKQIASLQERMDTLEVLVGRLFANVTTLFERG